MANIMLDVMLDFKNIHSQVKNIKGVINKGITGGPGTGAPRISTGMADPKVTKNLNNIADATKKIGTNAVASKGKAVDMLNAIGVKGNSLIGIFSTLALKVVTWLIATAGIFAVIRLFKELVAQIKQLEDATIRLQRVMQGNRAEVEANTRAAYGFAKSMNVLAAATYDETIDSLQTAVRAGFEFKEAMDLARTSLIATNVTVLKAGEATRFLIATIRQFNLSAKDSLWILNQWNELGKRTGATTKDIAEGVTRAGKAWQSAGGSLAQLNAVVAATVEATGQSGEKVGTTLKTLSARFSDLNRSQSLHNKLTEVGIRIEKLNSREQNSIFSVLGRLSARWSTLDKRQKASIAKAAAGIRQYSKFIGVVDNFDNVVKALIVSIDSNNSALDENERRAKSLDFAIKQLKGSFQELALNSTGLLNIMKGVVRTTASVLDMFNQLAGSRIGQFVTSLALTMGGLALTMKAIAGTLMLITGGAFAGPIGMIAGIGAALLGYIVITKDAKRAQRELFSGMSSDIRSAINSGRDLLDNSKEFLKIFTDTRTSSKRKSQIAEMFKNVSGIDITEELKPGADFNKAVTKINEQIAAGLTDESALRKFKDKLINQGGGGSIWLEYINRLLGSPEDIRKKLEERKQITLKIIENSLGVLDDKGIAPFRDDLNNINELINSLPPELIKVDNVLEKIQVSADKVQEITAKMYQGIVDATFELKEGQTVLDNLQNVFIAVGDLLYNEVKNSIVEGMIAGMKEAVFISDFKDAISNSTKDIFNGLGDLWTDPQKTNQPLAKLLTNLGIGAAAGAATGGATGRDIGSSASQGALYSLIGEFLAPGVGGIIGGLIGGLTGSPEAKDQEAKEIADEQIKYSRDSVRELKQVNRNLTVMIDEIDPFSIRDESYYFSVSSSRGLN